MSSSSKKDLIDKIALGTVQFGVDYGISNNSGIPKKSEAFAILDYCKKKNITYLDTASAYGTAESVLGGYGMESFHIVSKFINCTCSQDLTNQFESSIKRLEIPNLYAYLAHRPEELIRQTDLWVKLLELKEAGLIKKIGASFNKPEELDLLISQGKIPDIIQIPYNILDQRFDVIASELHNKGTEIHARSVFLQGLFFMNPNDLDEFFQPVKNFLSELQSNIDYVSYLLQFVVNKSYIDKVIIGVTTVNQLKQNLTDLSKPSLTRIRIPELTENILLPSNWPKRK